MSTKRLLPKSEEEAVYRRAISMLLEGIASNALNLDRDVCRNFRERIGKIRREMASEATVAALLGNAGSAVQAIRDYARGTTRLVHTQGVEVQDMVAVLDRTVVDIEGVGGGAMARLQKIGDDLERAAAMESVSSLKARLRQCLGAIREEARKQQAVSDQMVRTLRREVSHKQAASRNLGLDPITELPCETVAQGELLSALHSGEQKHVAVFVLGSARHINLRFGRAAGDDVVRALKEYLAGQLESEDRLFRWPGPAIVALLAGTEPFKQVRARMKRFLDQPIEQTFDIDGHFVSIPLCIAWSVFALSPPLEDVHRQINDFIASQGYRDEDPIPA